MPNAVMEAMASELPVVSTDAGGVRELVLEGDTGFIVPCADPDALAARMLHMMRLEPEARRALGAAGRQRILQEFENERVVDHWESMVRGLIESTSGPEALIGCPAGIPGAALGGRKRAGSAGKPVAEKP
jgi:glycosyltransferase involved in cell wall biosynthesis